MKNKGFTLIELLGVVILLGILSLITFPIILKQIKNAKQGIKESTELLIIDAAKDYYEDNTNDYDLFEGITYCINVSTLTENNYLNKRLKDDNLNDIDTTKQVKMTYHNDRLNYEVTDKCKSNVLARNNIVVPIVTEGKGLYESTTDPGRLIYRGENPNNYIALKEDGTNDTLYRIVSYEPDGTIKVVRNDELSDIKWWDRSTTRINTDNTYCNAETNSCNACGCNAWGNGSNTLYNGETLGNSFHYIYYDSPTTTTMTNGTTGTVTSDSTLNTYLNDTWLPTSLSNYIDNHSWNVGGVYYPSSSSDDKGIIKEKEEERQLQWIGKIGLLNITEFVETSTNPNCVSVRSNYGSASGYPCKIDNWTRYDELSSEWTLSAFSYFNNQLWCAYNVGGFGACYGDAGFYLRPAFFLKADIDLTGEGTEANPYKLAGEE